MNFASRTQFCRNDVLRIERSCLRSASRDLFIILSSNICAIRGLRAMYFLFAGVMDMFRYLQYGLSAVLGCVVLKRMGEYWLAQEGHQVIAPWTSLAVVVSLLGLAIAGFLAVNYRDRNRARTRAAILIKLLEKQADKAIREEAVWQTTVAPKREHLAEWSM